jgi:FkbH-like protein
MPPTTDDSWKYWVADNIALGCNHASILAAIVSNGFAADTSSGAVPAEAAPTTVTFRENIRLVIWDLDQTFWRGTLTEGEVAWVDEHENIVKALAARGIVSSICSKNDFDPVMAILKSRNLDSYFIFPSIDWSPKGNRVKAIIENAQLRAETVLFLDDNHLGRAEVAETNPGVNVASELFIPHLLSHPQLAGKDDHDLTRLAQYKSLERRKQAATGAGENADDFLRHSGIKVFIDYDLEGAIDRCIELINRTNQLNFTKQRLPPDPAEARQAFLDLIHEPRIQGGLIHCHDKYGDHGYVGLYVILEGRVLKHFLFSCRVLGMGLEQWLYKRLGAPYLDIVGPVLSDPKKDGRNVDWIELVAAKEPAAESEHTASHAKKIDHFYVLGGCVMENIGHYLQVFSEKVVHEGNARRDGIDIRRTHTCFLTYGEWLANEHFLTTITQLGCIKEDFENRIFQADEKSALVLSFWYDQICALYQHKELPIELPFLIEGVGWDADLTTLNFEDLPAEFKAAKDASKIFQYFKDHFTFKGYIEAESYQKRVNLILDRINPAIPVFILDVPSQREIMWRERQIQPDLLEPIQRVHRRLAEERKNVHVIDPLECVMEPSERLDWWHFDRKVYFRIFQRIMAVISGEEAPNPGPSTPPSVQVLTPAEAANRKGQKVTLQFRVQSAGMNGENTELYSEPSWDRPGNFFIRIPESTRKKFQERGLTNIASRFDGKSIRITGWVTTIRVGAGVYPCIHIEDPDQVQGHWE